MDIIEVEIIVCIWINIYKATLTFRHGLNSHLASLVVFDSYMYIYM